MQPSKAIAWLVALLPVMAMADGWPQTPLPAQTETEEVAQRIVFNGLDMRAQLFKSPLNPDQLVQYYRKQWDKLVVNKLGASVVVGHADGDYYTTVQISAAGSGSNGNIGVIDIASAPRHPALGKGFPAPEGAKVFNDIVYPDDPTPARMVAMRDGLSPSQNAGYFDEHLRADGWKSAQRDPCNDSACVERYQRGNSDLTLVVTRLSTGNSQVVMNVLRP